MDELQTVVLSVTYRHRGDGDDQVLGWLLPTLERGAGIENVAYLNPRAVDELHADLVNLIRGRLVRSSSHPAPKDPAADPLRALLLEAFRHGAKAMHLCAAEGRLMSANAHRRAGGLVLNEDETIALSRWAADFTYATSGYELVVPSGHAADRWRPASHVVLRNGAGDLRSYHWHEIRTVVWRMASAVRNVEDGA